MSRDALLEKMRADSQYSGLVHANGMMMLLQDESFSELIHLPAFQVFSPPRR